MLNPWLLAVRPKTLPASVSPILLGTALAWYDGYFNGVLFSAALFCALMLQVAVNFANDLFDADSGVDTPDRLGPVRVTQSGLISRFQLKTALFLVCILAVASGLVLVALSSVWLFAFGVASIVGVFAYSGGPWPLASHGLGEITVLLFFGWIAVAGSYFVYTLNVSGLVLAYGTVAGLFSAAIMLVNNIRDISTDVVAGKHTLAVKLGVRNAKNLYKGMLVLALLLHFVISFGLGLWSILPAIAVAPLMRTLLTTIEQRHGAELNLQLAQTAKLGLIYCTTTSVVLVGLSF